MVLLDTDHLSILTNRQAAKHEMLLEKLEASAEEFALPIVAIEFLGRFSREAPFEVAGTLQAICKAGIFIGNARKGKLYGEAGKPI